MEKELMKVNYLDDLSLVEKALEKARLLHSGQYRDSSDDYIVHPIAVFNILSKMRADQDTLCAGLLHDTLEDTDYSKEDMIEEFGYEVFKLVDGVTKEKEDKFDNSLECDLYNYNKLALYSSKDVRVMIIKLADRLHNMRTLSSKSKESIISNSQETMDYYVPMADVLGMNYMKVVLEDLAFKHLYETLYDEVYAFREQLIDYFSYSDYMEEIMKYLDDFNIEGDIQIIISGILESYISLKYGDAKIFKSFVITDDSKAYSCLPDYLKVISRDEYDFLINGVANGFKDKRVFDFFSNSDLSNNILSVNDEYCKKLKRKIMS